MFWIIEVKGLKSFVCLFADSESDDEHEDWSLHVWDSVSKNREDFQGFISSSFSGRLLKFKSGEDLNRIKPVFKLIYNFGNCIFGSVFVEILFRHCFTCFFFFFSVVLFYGHLLLFWNNTIAGITECHNIYG